MTVVPMLRRPGPGVAQVAGFAAALALLGPGREARAAPDRCQARAECKRISDEAQSFYQQQDYYRALRLLQQAYELQNEPRLLINIGRCFFRLTRPLEAAAAYRQFLSEDTERDAELRARVERYLEEAEADAARRAAPLEPTQQRPLAPTEPVEPAEPPPAELSLVPPEPVRLAVERRAPSVKKTVPVHKRPALWIGIGAGLAVSAVVIGLCVGLLPVEAVPHRVVEWP